MEKESERRHDWLVISALSRPTSQFTPATATREETGTPHGSQQRDGDQHSQLQYTSYCGNHDE
jgi:hypothetical protein